MPIFAPLRDVRRSPNPLVLQRFVHVVAVKTAAEPSVQHGVRLPPSATAAQAQAKQKKKRDTVSRAKTTPAAGKGKGEGTLKQNKTRITAQNQNSHCRNDQTGAGDCPQGRNL